MKKIYSNILSLASSIMRPAISLALLLTAAGATAQSKICPEGRMFLQRMDIEKKLNPLSPLSLQQPQTIKALISLSDGATAEDLTDCTIDCTIGDKFAIVDMPLENLDKLESQDAVRYISFGEERQFFMNTANAGTAVDVLHAGTDLPKAYNGEGTLALIYDSGFDPNHPAFKASDGKTNRVKYFYNQKTGTTYTESNISSVTTDNTGATHGNLVAGIMAGRAGYNGQYGYLDANGNGAYTTGSIPFVGVAPKADIAIVGATTMTTSNIIAGVKKLADYAKSTGKPAVINLSVGELKGPHSGKTAYCEALDEIAKDITICMAAGNDGNRKCSYVDEFTSSHKSFKLTMDLKSQKKEGYSVFWSNNADDLGLRLILYDAVNEKYLDEIDVTGNYSVNNSEITDHFASYLQMYLAPESYITVTKGLDSYTNCQFIYIYTHIDQKILSSDYNIIPVFKISGTPGTKVIATTDGDFDNGSTEILGQEFGGLTILEKGDDKNSISDDACGFNTISVGSWNSKTNFAAYDGVKCTCPCNESNTCKLLSRTSEFSASGTTMDGRKLPHVAAPGHGVISATNSYVNGLDPLLMSAYATVDGKNYYWNWSEGTSMASPQVAGIALLLLQARPDLTPQDIRTIITETAVSGEGDKYRAGHGYVDASKAMKMALEYTGVGEVFENEDLRLLVTPNGGKNYSVFLAGVDHFNATLYNLSGSAVKSAAFEGNEGTLDASDLASGIYVLEVKADNAHFTQKIVIK